MIKHSSWLVYGGIEPAADDSSLYFSVYNVAIGSPNVCTMFVGKVSLTIPPLLAWQKMATASTSLNQWCLIPQDVILQSSSYVYFTATVAYSGTTNAAEIFKSNLDGTNFSLLRGFGTSGGATYLLSY